jgi:MscS family membrane protein
MVFETYGEQFAERTDSKMDDQVLPILRRLSKLVLWVAALLLVLDNMGFDVMTLITGLGIGGLAIAMAAKETIAHLLGGVTIFVDQPFRVGDSVDLSGTSGKVEEVGLRTTRVRSWEGNLVIIPNATTANGKVENISQRPKIRVRFVLGLQYSTPVDKCRDAVDRVVEAIQQATETTDDPVCQFVSFGESALDFQVTYYIPTSASLNDVKHDVNLAIMDALSAAGVSLAFPTMTVDLPEGAALKAS